jgi:hypothetical protein
MILVDLFKFTAVNISNNSFFLMWMYPTYAEELLQVLSFYFGDF